MRCLLVLTIAALATCHQANACDKDECPDPSEEPAIFVKRIHRADRNENYSFKFAVAGMKPLCKCKINLKKVVKRNDHPELKDTDFEISLKTLSEEELKEWNETSSDGQHYRHVVVGRVKTGSLKCRDQAPYLVRYGDRRQGEDEDTAPHHHKAFFFIELEGCKKPDPGPNKPLIFVKKFHVATLNETYGLSFTVATGGKRPPFGTEIRLKKVVKGKKDPELEDTDFNVSLKILSEEEIKEWMEKKGHPDRLVPFKHAIRGSVETGVLSCQDQGPYMVIYGDRGPAGEGEQLKPRGFFYILVEGCKPPREH